MQKRMLGSSGLEVSAVGLGCMRMSAGHGEVGATKEEMIELLRGAVERGITFFDTAQVYGPFVKHFGLSEAGAQTIRRAHAVQALTALQANTPSGGSALKKRSFLPWRN